MVIEVKLLQKAKAKLPILVTLLGIVVFLQPDVNMFVDVSIMALHFSLES